MLLKVLQRCGQRSHLIFGVLLLSNLIILCFYFADLDEYSLTMKNNLVQEVLPVLVPPAHQVIRRHKFNVLPANMIDTELSDWTNVTQMSARETTAGINKTSPISRIIHQLVPESYRKNKSRRKLRKNRKTSTTFSNFEGKENMLDQEDPSLVHHKLAENESLESRPFESFNTIHKSIYNSPIQVNSISPFSLFKNPPKVFIHKAMLPSFVYEPNIFVGAIRKVFDFTSNIMRPFALT